MTGLVKVLAGGLLMVMVAIPSAMLDCINLFSKAFSFNQKVLVGTHCLRSCTEKQSFNKKGKFSPGYISLGASKKHKEKRSRLERRDCYTVHF